MTIEVRDKAPNFNGHIVVLVLHLWGFPRIIEMILNIRVKFNLTDKAALCDFLTRHHKNSRGYRSA
jgi:hypothetical protein